MSEQMTVAEAQAALDAAIERCNAAEDAANRARAAVFAAQVSVRNARMRADSLLPQAVVVTRLWLSDKKTREEWVVTKRSPKTITVREPGGTRERQFRFDGNEWRPHPKPTSYSGASCTLELPETQENKV